MRKSGSVSYSSPKKPKKSFSSYFSKPKSKGFFLLSRHRILSVLGYILLGFCILLFLGLGAGYVYVGSQLPDITEDFQGILPEATVITDRNNEILYKIYQENRTYMQFQDISPFVVDAIVAIEDKTFWTNDGVDLWGIVRAAKTAVMGGPKTGASTITQQLLKNIILKDEPSKYMRKLKERMLASELNDLVRGKVKAAHPDALDDEIERLMKEEIIELYLNYIFLGQNSYGVQAASQTFFNKNVKGISPLEASILASLPKSPSKYNPYKNRAPVMGKLRFYSGEKEVEATTNLNKTAVDRITKLLPALNLDGLDVESSIKKIAGLATFSITVDNSVYDVKYFVGRKDYVLLNMISNDTLEVAQFKKAFLDAFTYEFVRGESTMKAPHFVWWIKDLVLEKYPEKGEDLLEQGLQITTTLDYKIQQMAEKSMESRRGTLASKYGAKNSAMIHLNTTNGDVLAYVGSSDYNNEEIDGKVDVIRSLRQPGSSIKPFIYALGVDKLGLTMDTPLYDLKLPIAGKLPHNVDGKFEGYMPLREALAGSRNIAPIKIFLSVGNENAVKPFLWNLGLRHLQSEVSYGYPLSIGAGEVHMLELANAYAHLSAAGKPAAIDPILEIKFHDGSVLYKKKVVKQKQRIPTGVANLLSQILSNRSNMPSSWVRMFTLRGGLKYATKTGTSNMKVGRTSRARDGRLAAYTPSFVSLFWSGNTDATPMYANAYGSVLNTPIRKTFWGKLLASNNIAREGFSWDGTKPLNIEKYSGCLPASGLPEEAIVKTRAYVGKGPRCKSPERKPIEYDVSCNGRATDLTPKEDLKEGWIFDARTFMPNKRDLSEITKRFSTQTGFFMEEPKDPCEGRLGELDPNISISITDPSSSAEVLRKAAVSYSATSSRNLKVVKFYVNDIQVSKVDLPGNSKTVDSSLSFDFSGGVALGNNNLSIEVVDEGGYFNKKSVAVVLVDALTPAPDTVAPTFLQSGASAMSGSSTYTVRLPFADESNIASISVTNASGAVVLSTIVSGSVALFELPSLGSVTYVVTDSANNVLNGTIDLSQL